MMKRFPSPGKTKEKRNVVKALKEKHNVVKTIY